MNAAQDKLFKEGLEKIGLKTLESQCESFFRYLKLLEKWNSAYNLTAIREIDAMIPKHLLDSLALSPWLQGNSLLDVGTGPGLPGIPLALAYPDLKITLLDSNGKKICFLQEVKRQLGISNIEIIQARVEEYSPPSPFDMITSRAFSSIGQFIEWTRHLLAKNGTWLAMKGQIPNTELEEIKQFHEAKYSYEIKTYQIPLLPDARCCVIIKNEGLA